MSSSLHKAKEAARKRLESEQPKPLSVGDFTPHFVLVFLLAGTMGAAWWLGGYALQNARQVVDGWRSDSWPSVQGTVIRSEAGVHVTRTRQGASTSTSRMLYASVHYRYEVKGKLYTNNRITYDVGFRCFQGKNGVWHDAKNSKEVDALLQTYPKGRKVTVYYKPSDPSVSTLERGWGLLPYITVFPVQLVLLMVVLLIAGLAVYGLVFFSRKLMTSRAQCRSSYERLKRIAAMTEAEFRSSTLTGDLLVALVMGEEGDCRGVTLDGVVLPGEDLYGLDFTGATITGSCFEGSGFHGTSFVEATLRDVSFKEARVGVDFTGATLEDVSFDDADMGSAILTNATLVKVTFKDTNLNAAQAGGVDLSLCSLRGARLRKSDLHEANLAGVDLKGADLSGANLAGATLEKAILKGADLSGANLEGANLRGANLNNAKVSEANFRGADLRQSNLRWVEITTADIEDADLRGATIRYVALDEKVLATARTDKKPQ